MVTKSSTSKSASTSVSSSKSDDEGTTEREKVSTAAITDDATWDWGTRFRPNRNVPPTLHLGGMPTIVSSGTQTLDENLPDVAVDPVIPPSNVPLEKLVQKLVDKALDEKEKSELTQSEVFPGPPALTPEEAEESQKADAEATAEAAEADRGVGSPTQPDTTAGGTSQESDQSDRKSDVPTIK